MSNEPSFTMTPEQYAEWRQADLKRFKQEMDKALADQERPPDRMTNQDIVRSFEATKDAYNDMMLKLDVLKGQLESHSASTSASILFITQRLRALEKTEPQTSAQLEAKLAQDFEAMTQLELTDYMLDLEHGLNQADKLYSRAIDRMQRVLAIKTRKAAEPK